MNPNEIICNWETNLKAYGVTDEGIEAVKICAAERGMSVEELAGHMMQVITGGANMSLLGEQLGTFDEAAFKQSEAARYRATHDEMGNPISARKLRRAGMVGLSFSDQLKEAYRSRREQ